MQPNERIQELESKNIRLQAQHNQDIELLMKALASLTKSQVITKQYEIITDKMQEMNDDIMENWKETIDMLTPNFLTRVIVGILLLITVENIAEIFLK